MQNEEPVTKAYLDQALKTALDEALERHTATLMAKITELIYDSETRLLRGFADYQSSASIRFRKLESDVSNTDTSSTLRLGKLEEKISDLEIRILKLEDRPPHRAA
jgi:hypothetical protein